MTPANLEKLAAAITQLQQAIAVLRALANVTEGDQA